MLPSMRFYIISIVSIFIALGIGIFIGFTIDTQNFIIEQKQNISETIESQFQILMTENQTLKANENLLKSENKYKNEYMELSYEFMTKNKLSGLKIGIIETNEDYVRSHISKDLELAGAKVINITTLKNIIVDKEKLNNLYKKLDINIPKNSVETVIRMSTESIISGIPSKIFGYLEEEGFINIAGIYNEAIDYLIICGGSLNEESKRISQIDRIIVEVAKEYNIPNLGVEKSNSNYSYIHKYKDLGISTVDNIDTTMGKVAMVLAMEGMTGNFGTKDTADSVIPHYNLKIQE